MIATIKLAYNIEEKGLVSWFLNVYVLRNREKQTITLIYNKYINKIAKKFNLVSLVLFLVTSLSLEELTKSIGEALKCKIKDY